MNLKGSLPALILETLTRGPSHGHEIAQTIKRKSAGVLDFKQETPYPALRSLERDGLITASEHLENGRTRRTYTPTEKGMKNLAEERQQWQAYSGAISGILGGAS
jgi:PadR family transcriptional regulator, regulatory protein PadR